MRITTAAAALGLWIPTVCMAGHETPEKLTIGDKAPALEISHWLKGEPVEAFEPGQIYVVEFWATWCGSCRASIPHLSEMQEKYDDYDVTFVGVSDENLQTVVKFLCKADSSDALWNEKMHYTVAADPDSSTHDAYMEPAGRTTIPTAFVVGKDSRIEWIGGPMDLEPVLGQVVRDAWDRSEFKVAYEKEVAPVREYLALRRKIDAAVDAGDWDAAIEKADAIAEQFPQHGYVKVSLFRKMLHDADDAERTFAYGTTIMKEQWDDANTLNSLAWYTVDDRGVPVRDLDFALKAAERASELTDHANPAILDTLARVHYERGDLPTAIRLQRQAVEHAGTSPIATDLKETLIRYEKQAAARL